MPERVHWLPTMNISRLEGFFYVAQHRSFRQAARLFPYPITPAGLHQQVHRLEIDVGTKLLKRLNRNEMTTTAAGQTLFNFVKPFFDGLPQVAQQLTGTVTQGALRLVSSIHLLKHFLQPVLRQFHHEFPLVEVSFIEAREPDVSGVWLGTIDLFIDFVPHLLPGLEAKRVESLHAYLAIPTPPKRKPFELSQLKETTFIAYAEGRSNRLRQLEGLATLKLRPSRILSAESSETILGLVAGGLGFSIVPLLAQAVPATRDVQLIPIKRSDAVFPVSAVFRSSDRNDPGLKRLLELMPSNERK
jgi:DNA-binding transcriptional LysR family regulator